jgi:hypothetical protein
MTVIAYKDGVMAADTMVSSHNSQNRAQKIVRLPDGGVAGGCGLWTHTYATLKYLADGGDPSGEKVADLPSVKDSAVLIAKPDGSLWVLEEEFPAYPLLDKVASIGCGSDAALMAMTLGLSAVEAVAKVTRQDVLCGDPVQSMEVEQPVEFSAVVTHRKPPVRRKRK